MDMEFVGAQCGETGVFVRDPLIEARLMSAKFKTRYRAGASLAALLTTYADRDDVVVVALPRGGVPVGFEVACALHAPLDILVVRKLGTPGYPELAMGAIAGGDVRVLNRDLLRQLRIHGAAVDRVALQREHVARVVVAVPVASHEACETLGSVADEVVSVLVPESLMGVGRWYENFDQTSDDEVRMLLSRAEESYRAHPRMVDATAT